MSASLLLSVSSVFTYVLYIVLAILVLLLMVTIHELGHYTAGKILKFKINEFSVGFGKKLWSKKTKSGEVVSLRLFPLGGYCAFEGEDEEGNKNKNAFNNQKPWKRLIVLFMGPFFNILSAVIFSMIFLMAYGYADKIQVTTADMPNATYIEQTADSPAYWDLGGGVTVDADQWFEKGDVILAVNGQKTSFITDDYFPNMVVNYNPGVADGNPTDSYTVLVKRGGKDITLNIHNTYVTWVVEPDAAGKATFTLNGTDYSYQVIPNGSTFVLKNINNNATYNSDETGTWLIGGNTRLYFDPAANGGQGALYVSRVGITSQYYHYGFFEALGYSWVFAFGWAWKVLVVLWGLITGAVSLSSVGGPITTISTIASATEANFANFFLLLPIIAANLAVFNILPFPALDGARMVFVGLEWLFKKPVVSRKTEGYIHMAGMLLLILFVVIIDLMHFL